MLLMIPLLFCFTGCIKYKPASPSSNLYPDLSLIANDDHEIETSMTPLEVQSMACKVMVLVFFIKCIYYIYNFYNQCVQRRSNGSSALNTSTASSESVPEESDDADILGAKRYRCQQKENNPDTIDVTALQEVIIGIYLYIIYTHIN